MFVAKDVVCFFGDSITADGRWIAEIYENVMPNGVRLYNCGIAGDRAEWALKRLYCDCLIYSPDYVVIMFGMNDIQRELYITQNYEQIEQALRVYSSCMTELVERCMDAGSEVILCTPTPYDEKSNFDEENLYCNKGLLRCTETVFELAKRYCCKVVDFNTVFNNKLGTLEFINEDRVHPNDLGHHMMSLIFMDETGITQRADFEASFVMSGWNKERYDSEQLLRNIAFVDRCVLYEDKQTAMLTLEQAKKIIQKRYDESEKTGYVPEMYKLYLENIDFKESYHEKLIEKTIWHMAK